MKLKCAMCLFTPVDDEGNRPPARNAEYVWEGVSLCLDHLKERRLQLMAQAQQQHNQQRGGGLLVPVGPADPLT